jgi:SAM-dependent methyltransferase
MYDAISVDYDRFVNWGERLAFEMPFIEQCLSGLKQTVKPIRVLDAACGTGWHVIELRRKGYEAYGADISTRMIERAIANAATANVLATFKVAGFGELAKVFLSQSMPHFDALLCLGNSLPHVSGLAELENTLKDFVACLRPGGLLLIQNRNFDAVLEQHLRWMELGFNMLILHRDPQNQWQQVAEKTTLYPLRKDEIGAALKATGVDDIIFYGSMSGEPYDSKKSGNLVVLARLPQS